MEVEGRCATCAWWGGHLSTKPPAPYKYCYRLRYKPGDTTPYVIEAFAEKGRWIATLAEFGCVLWEGKEQYAPTAPLRVETTGTPVYINAFNVGVRVACGDPVDWWQIPDEAEFRKLQPGQPPPHAFGVVASRQGIDGGQRGQVCIYGTFEPVD